MKVSLKKFVLIFLVSCFVFRGITDLLLRPIVNGTWFPGTDSPIAWKRNLAAVIYPIKVVLVGPLSQVFNDPDPAPPIRAIACAVYWTAMALVIYFIFFIFSKIFARRKV